jgi:ribosomal protein L37E
MNINQLHIRKLFCSKCACPEVRVRNFSEKLPVKNTGQKYQSKIYGTASVGDKPVKTSNIFIFHCIGHVHVPEHLLCAICSSTIVLAEK